jgi:hypothetical protein
MVEPAAERVDQVAVGLPVRMRVRRVVARILRADVGQLQRQRRLREPDLLQRDGLLEPGRVTEVQRPRDQPGGGAQLVPVGELIFITLGPVAASGMSQSAISRIWRAFGPSGSVIAQHCRRHRHQKFLRFLKLIDAAVPSGLELHLMTR